MHPSVSLTAATLHSVPYSLAGKAAPRTSCVTSSVTTAPLEKRPAKPAMSITRVATVQALLALKLAPDCKYSPYPAPP